LGRLYLYLVLAAITLIGFLLGQTVRLTGYNTQTGNFTANVVTGLACTFSDDALNVSFGDNVTLGASHNATKNFVDNHNYTNYNITADSSNSGNANITIKGSNFVTSGSTLGVGNVSWASNITDSNGTNMVFPGTAEIITDSYDTTNLIAENIGADTTASYRMWLTVPSSLTAGQYKGNYSLRCFEA
jgi:hypothetical protein